jgi:hypothetical protein
MNLTYVFGPVTAVDTLLNVNVQFHRVYDRQEKDHGWGWGVDGDVATEEPSALLELDESAAIEELLTSLRDELHERVAEWREEHPLATKKDRKRAAEVGITLP